MDICISAGLKDKKTRHTHLIAHHYVHFLVFTTLQLPPKMNGRFCCVPPHEMGILLQSVLHYFCIRI